MKTTNNVISQSIHILAALKSKVGFYRNNLLKQIIVADPENSIVRGEIQLINGMAASIENCLNEIGLDRQYNLKQLRKRKTPIIFGETFLDVFLLRSPALSNSLHAGSPHCGSALQFYVCYMLYTLCRDIHFENNTADLLIPIAANKEWMISLIHFKKSHVAPLSLIAALGIIISKQQSTTGKKNFNHIKYKHND